MVPYLGWILFSVVVGLIGRKRKFGFWGFFLASVFFSPLLIILVLLLTEPNYEDASGASQTSVQGGMHTTLGTPSLTDNEAHR
jgi:hypothetical protein